MTATHGVLGVVVLFVLTYIFRCLNLIRLNDPHARLQRLCGQFQDDIAERVASGRNLDWTHYSDEAQRKHEDLREHLRNYGTISLATGVGGTMGALAWYLMISAGDASELSEMLGEMGWALVASGTGVLGNLAILWWLLPLANRRFNPKFDRFLDTLHKEETKQRARVDTQSETTAKINGVRFDEDLRRVIARAPSMFDNIGETATVLNGAAAKLQEDVAKLTSASSTLVQSTSNLKRMPEDLDDVLRKALADLLGEANALRDAMRKWESEKRSAVAESYAELRSAIERASFQHDKATESLDKTVRFVSVSLPDQVASAVEKSGESLRDGVAEGLGKMREWQNTMNEHLSEARKQHDRAMHDVGTMATDVVVRVQSLPGAVADGVERISDKLGREFGHQARQHVRQLESSLHKDAEARRRKREEHENHLLNTTVQELRKVSERLLNKTVHDLEGVSEKLAKVLDRFPEQVAVVNTRLADVESELTDIVARIEETSSALRSAHDRTGDMLSGLGRSTEDLGKVIRELAEALRKPWWKGWWRKFRRRPRDETPSATPSRSQGET